MRFIFTFRRLALCGAAAGLISVQPAVGADQQTNLYNAPVEFRCADQREIVPLGYLLALHYGDAKSIGQATAAGSDPGFPFAIRANVVVHVGTSEGYFPLTLRQRQPGGEYLYGVNCTRQLNTPDYFPAVQIRIASEDDRTELWNLLVRRIQDTIARGSVEPLLFSGSDLPTALIPMPARVSSYGSLVSGYLATRPDAAFLGLFTGNALLQSTEPARAIINFKHESVRSRVAQADDKTAPAQAGTAATPQAATPQAASGTAPPPGQAAAPDGDDSAPKPRQKRKVQIRLVNKVLAALDLAAPGAIDTYGYCTGIKRDAATAGAYVLEDCVTDDKQQLPLHVAGFAPLVLVAGSQAVRLDPLLISRSYNVPYAASWQGAATDAAEVPGGSIEEVLKRRVIIRQFGLAACEVSVNLTLADIRAETLSFPEPPCRTIDLQFPQELAGKTPPAVAECLPGTNQPVSASAAGVARCVVTAAELKAGTKSLRLAWAPGFDIATLNLPTNKGPAAAMSAADVARFLRPTLPRQEAARTDTSAPAYRPVEVRYQIGNQPCGKAALPFKSNTVPTLAEAGCTRLPDRMELTFEIDKEKSDPTIPLDAFKDKVTQTVMFGSPQSGATMQVDGSRAGIKLPVDFNSERKQRYGEQFTQAAELLVAGAKIYTVPDCGDRAGPPKVALFAKSEKGEFQWPVYGQVFDNEGRALTDCAKSIVERADNRAYLTFEFKSTRAAGPRRTIIVARSQDLMDKRGLPKSLDTAFVNFAKMANDLHKRGAALSPVDVLSVRQDGTMQRVFTGEDAALQLQSVEANLSQLDKTAPKTPDLSLLRLQPETKAAERVIIIMDGSTTTARQVSELRLLASDIAARKGGSLQFLLSSDSCALWQPHAAQLRCVELGAMQPAERDKALSDAFNGLLNGVGTKAEK